MTGNKRSSVVEQKFKILNKILVIDYAKAFDGVDHSKLWKILEVYLVSLIIQDAIEVKFTNDL